MNNIIMLQRLHHFAWKCVNIKQTTHFYSKILQLPLVKTIKKDYVPSTREYKPYEHIFFKLPDNSHIAFFKTDDIPTYINKIHTFQTRGELNNITIFKNPYVAGDMYYDQCVARDDGMLSVTTIESNSRFQLFS